MDSLQATNDALKRRGVRGRIVVAKNRLFLRGTFTDVAGARKDRRIPLGVPASNLLVVVNLYIALAGIINATGVVPAELPWDAPAPSTPARSRAHRCRCC